jgi:hypothetical protein
MLKKKTVKKTCKSSVRKKSGGWGTTGLYQIRKHGGNKYTRYHVENTKSEAEMMANRYRSRGNSVRIVKYKGKYAVDVRH